MPVWDGVVRLRAPARLRALVAELGGAITASEAGHDADVLRIVPVERAAAGDLAPLTAPRYLRAGEEARARGAALLVDASLGELPGGGPGALWISPEATGVLASILERCEDEAFPAVVGEGSVVGPGAWLGDRVVIGRNVTIGPGAVIGAPGFGWAMGTGGVRRVPQLGGVVIDDDVAIGPLCTIDAGTLGPTRIGRGVKLDAQVHVGHNVEIGEGTLVAAQSGFAGSVRIGKGVLVGGQAGFADHVRVGDGARIAAKSGVIGDVEPGSTVAGFPAVPKARWLRAWASLLGERKRRGA
ncbi:MAG TPA: UDP-3-O-(3-hydroxymyristoyl)glucosamine N-acyltransferase [Polyangiaceae bacterium]